jgi:hypothetical protein
MSTETLKKYIFLRSEVRPVRGADKPTAIYEPIVYTVGSLTSHNPIRPPRLVMGIALIIIIIIIIIMA